MRVCADFWILVVRPGPSSTALCGAPCTRKSFLNGFSCSHSISRRLIAAALPHRAVLVKLLSIQFWEAVAE